MPLVPVFRTPAWISQFVLLAIGIGAFFFQSPWVGSALILMAALHIFRTLGQLSNPELLQKSLTKVGFEAMAGSMVFSILVVIGLLRSTT
jgi:hypothetical protein